MANNRNITVSIDGSLCKGCELCVATCQEGVLVMSRIKGPQGYFIPEVVYPQRCSGCLACELSCPDMAIEILS